MTTRHSGGPKRQCNGPNAEPERKEIEAAARKMGADILVLHAAAESDFRTAFGGVAQAAAGALVIAADPFFGSRRSQIVTLAVGSKTPYGDFDDFRGQIATVFQQDRLLPWRSALDNVQLPLEITGVPEAKRRQRSMSWLTRLGLQSFAHAYPRELSGGMRQRVAIARAFVLQPTILLADEAFGHLDEVTAAELRETFLALARECGSTAVLITHQLEEAIGVGDRVVVFAKPARVLADIHIERWEKREHATLREAIQVTLQSNKRDERLLRAAAS
ncbi:MAG: ABC transporter ATP-binding protein [Xanthobacteraceae bacterium]